MIETQDFVIPVVDARLSGKTRLQVLKEAKESKPYIESIVITAYPSAELAVEARKLGTADYPAKPVAPDALEKLIRETLLKGKGGHQEGEGLLLF